MPRTPIGDVAMTGAERMRRYRLKHGVTKSVTKPTAAHPDHVAEELDKLRRERDAALERCRQLEAQLQRADAVPNGQVIATGLYKFVRATLHPDRVTDPEAKQYLQAAFVRFTEAVEKAGGAQKLPSMEEMMRRRAEAFHERSARSKKAAAARKARKAAAE